MIKKFVSMLAQGNALRELESASGEELFESLLAENFGYLK